MPSTNFLFEVNKYAIILAFFQLSFIQYSGCEMCLKSYKTGCEFAYNNGSIIDLTSLGSRSEPRFKNLKAVNHTDNFTYSYNPCFGFKLGPSGTDCSKGVAVCQANLHENQFYDCGDVDNVKLCIDDESNELQLLYRAPDRRTNITLVCSEDAIEPKLVVQGELLLEQYFMTLTTRCACPDACRTSHLSAGSVLVILFMIFVALYLVLGIIHSSLTRGAHGWELIPHYEFWADFPLLVRDGCVFVINGCKPETAYERI